MIVAGMLSADAAGALIYGMATGSLHSVAFGWLAGMFVSLSFGLILSGVLEDFGKDQRDRR